MDRTEDQWVALRRGVARTVADAKLALRECAMLNRKARVMASEAKEAVARAQERVARARARLAAVKLPGPR